MRIHRVAICSASLLFREAFTDRPERLVELLAADELVQLID
jgi:hypothetical protein